METSRWHRRRRRHRQTPGSQVPWVMLDRIIHLTKGDGDEVVNRDGVADGTLSEGTTCTGLPLAASLRVAEPPAVSRLYLHWPDGFSPEMSSTPQPSVIAAHGHSMLFTATVPFADHMNSIFYPVDYFVYSAAPPSLRRLPPCFKGGRVDPEVDKYFIPYSYQQQRMMVDGDMGLLCSGDDEFTVAELSYNGELCVLHHAPGQEEAMEWDIKQVQIPYGDGVPYDLMRGSWHTDAVVPYGGSSLCWFDCYLGLLVVAGFHGGGAGAGSERANPLSTRYIPLPSDLKPCSLYKDPEACRDAGRSVYVNGSGMMKLICIHDGAGGTAVHDTCSPPSFTITTWTLTKMRYWQKDATMEASEFHAALGSDRRLPQLAVMPQYPIMSFSDPDVICFVVRTDDFRLFWLVEVNIKKKKLGAVALYVSAEEEQEEEEEEEEEGSCGMVYTTPFCGSSLTPSQFTRYLDKHAIGSLGFSKKLQKAKLQRAMENGWIEDPVEELVRQIENNC